MVLTQSRCDSGTSKRQCQKGFPCGKSCQQKGRKCESPEPGQFSTYSEYIDNTVAHFASTSKGIAEIQGYLAVTRSIARNTSTKGRQQAVIRLYKQAQNDKQLHALLEKIDFQTVVTEPSRFVTESSKIHFTKDLTGKVTLKFVLATPDIKPIENSDDQLDRVVAGNSKDAIGLDIAKKYKESIGEINSLINTLNSKKDFTDLEYQQYFTDINKHMKDVAFLKDNANTIGLVSDSVVNEYINKITKISKEALPGHQLEVPSSLVPLKQKVADRPC